MGVWWRSGYDEDEEGSTEKKRVGGCEEASAVIGRDVGSRGRLRLEISAVDGRIGLRGDRLALGSVCVIFISSCRGDLLE